MAFKTKTIVPKEHWFPWMADFASGDAVLLTTSSSSTHTSTFFFHSERPHKFMALIPINLFPTGSCIGSSIDGIYIYKILHIYVDVHSLTILLKTETAETFEVMLINPLRLPFLRGCLDIKLLS